MEVQDQPPSPACSYRAHSILSLGEVKRCQGHAGKVESEPRTRPFLSTTLNPGKSHLGSWMVTRT